MTWTGVADRRRWLGAALACAASRALAAPADAALGAASIAALADEIWPEAERAGIARETVRTALRGLVPDPKVVALSRRQGEFGRPIAAYLQGAVTPGRIGQGRALASRWSEILAAVETREGVPPSIVLALWAMESGFGSDPGSFGTIRSLATLALASDRPALFRTELVAALAVVEREGIPASALTGSWAGAMGQPQFMPSSFLANAVDGDGDGRRDIWQSVPDVLASIGHFMAQAGWRAGLPWGVEVALPDGADLAVHARDFADWARLGLSRGDGRALPRAGEGRLFLPAGIHGPAFLLSENFEAIRAYNTSDAYALAVGHLADRIAGGGSLARSWPRERVLDGAERREVHRRLAALGLYGGTPDGKFGAQTRDAVRRFQIARGLVPDGYVGPDVLGALRRADR